MAKVRAHPIVHTVPRSHPPMTEQRKTLADEAYERVEEMIVTLELAPGSQISESKLSQKLDIGRTPLREGLQRLAEDRLLEIVPRKGIRITEINLRKHLSLLETRRVLDRLIATRATRRANRDSRTHLRTCAVAMHEAAAENKLSEFMQLDHRFDVIMGRAAENPSATAAVSPLHAHCRRFWYRFKATGDLAESARLHEELMRAVADRDEEKASECSDALIDYLERFTRSVLDIG